MAWAQNLLGFCFFACVSPSDGPAVLFRDDVGAILVEGFGPFSLFLVGSKSNVSAFFWLRFLQWLGHKTCLGSAFLHACPSLTDQRFYFETMSEQF